MGKWMVGWKDDRCMNTWIGGQKNSGLRDQRKNFIKEVGLHCALVCREKVGGLHMGELRVRNVPVPDQPVGPERKPPGWTMGNCRRGTLGSSM